jgi:DNA modification methylase
MQEQYIKLSDLRKVSGIGEKTIQRVRKEITMEDKPFDDVAINIEYPKEFDLLLNNFYVGESVKWMQESMPSNFVDLTVTSPPYDDLRNYNGFLFDYKAMLTELYRVTKHGGVVVWIVGDATVNGSETGTSFKQALYAKEIGFNLHDTMIFAKNNPVPQFKTKRYTNAFEYMFILTKGKPNTCNYLMEKTKNAGQIKSRNGKSEFAKQSADKPRNERTIVKEKKIKTNIWVYNVGAVVSNEYTKKHPATFPEQLAKDHILSWSNECDIVFDPMCGSGTTCKMAYLNNRKFIGVDVSKEYIDDICRPRLRQYGWSEANKTVLV